MFSRDNCFMNPKSPETNLNLLYHPEFMSIPFGAVKNRRKILAHRKRISKNDNGLKSKILNE